MWVLAVLAGVGLGVIAVGWHARGERARLRAAIAAEAKRAAEAGANAAATRSQPSVLPDDGAAIAELRGEIETLKRRVEERARARVADEQARHSVPVPRRERSLLEEMVPAEEWRNRGRATPTDTLETALWAAAGGDVTALAEMLTLPAAGRTKTETLLSQLPDSIRSQCATPEELVALLGTNDVPLGSARILVPDLKEGLGTWRVAQIADVNGETRRVAIAMEEMGGEWSLVVPERAIDGYAARLRGGEVGLGKGK